MVMLFYVIGISNAYCGLWGSSNSDCSEEGTVVNFTITERADVYEDTLKASLSVAEDNKDPKDLQIKINQKMQTALELAKKFPQVEAATEYYNVYKNQPLEGYAAKKEELTWHGSQQITLKSKSQEELLNLAGELQEQGLLMQNLSFGLSGEVSEKTKDAILASAIAKLQDKAKILSSLLNKGKAKIIEINIDNSNYQQPIMNKVMLLGSVQEQSVTTPAAEPAKVQVQLTMSAKVLIK